MFPVPATLDSAWLKVLVSQRDPLVAGDTARILLDYNLWLLPVCFELLVPKGQQEEEKLLNWQQLLTLIMQSTEGWFNMIKTGRNDI